MRAGPLRHIGGQPRHEGSAISEAAARSFQRRRGDIENSDFCPSSFDKVIDQTGCTTSDIDDARIQRQTGVLDQDKRGRWMILVPTDFGFRSILYIDCQCASPSISRPFMEALP